MLTCGCALQQHQTVSPTSPEQTVMMWQTPISPMGSIHHGHHCRCTQRPIHQWAFTWAICTREVCLLCGGILRGNACDTGELRGWHQLENKLNARAYHTGTDMHFGNGWDSSGIKHWFSEYWRTQLLVTLLNLHSLLQRTNEAKVLHYLDTFIQSFHYFLLRETKDYIKTC